jgi:cellulose synthase/poly-beta-1,6-N-acetylglucosamine synthase-like glycosyltransferase
VTDVPDQVPELISQRRRWLNGSFFAAIHSILHFHYLYRSSHGVIRKAWIHVELFYQVFNTIFAWFSLGNYYITFVILANAMEDPTFGAAKPLHIVNNVLEYLYLGLLVMCFLLREQVGVYECDPRVWSYHNLYDRKFPVVFVIFPAFLIFFIYYYFDCFDCFDHVLN